MKASEIDYQELSDEQIDTLVQEARNCGDAAVLQRPIESAVRESVADERGNWERPISDQIDAAKENFRTLRDRLNDAGVEYTIVESMSTSTSRNQLGQADEIEAILILLSFIPLFVFLPLGYILNKLGKERLRRKLLSVFMIGYAKRFYEESMRTTLDTLQRETDSLKAKTGTQPLVVVQRGSLSISFND